MLLSIESLSAVPVNIVQFERTLSGRGHFLVEEDFTKCRRILLYADVIRPPLSEYLNASWSPEKGFFASITFLSKGYVFKEVQMHFPKEGFVIFDDNALQLGASLVCHLDNVLDSFVSFAQALGLAYVKNNSITEHTYSAFTINQIRFQCYGGAAIKLALVGEERQSCKPEDAPSKEPPAPPPPPPPVPPGTPVEVDPPYLGDGSTDDGAHQPDPIDVPPPVPGNCTQAILNYTLFNIQFPDGLTADIEIGLPYQSVVITNGTTPSQKNVQVRASRTVDGFCRRDQLYGIGADFAAEDLDFVVNSITPL